MTMTRKDYQAIATSIDKARAQAFATTRHDHDQRQAMLEATSVTASNIAHTLGAENPRFDRVRFMDAALSGPEYVAAMNDEALARDIGPGTSKRGPTRLKFGFEQP